MIKEIKKGDRFKCKSKRADTDVIDGLTYTSHKDGELTVENGNLIIPDLKDERFAEMFNQDFELISTKTQAGLDMPVSCMPSEQDLVNAIGNLPPYYDNSNGSLYQIAEQRGWNAYVFDVVKRLERGGKKDPLKQEIEKSIGVLQLWLKEM